jgi:hypothetical protein
MGWKRTLTAPTGLPMGNYRRDGWRVQSATSREHHGKRPIRPRPEIQLNGQIAAPPGAAHRSVLVGPLTRTTIGGVEPTSERASQTEVLVRIVAF